ncbi:two-component response regulator ORR26-like isoform X1 [Trifolium pratense]|uniref:two-component response regulator ORR26-like isoform X1 n=2 Tax=Trifolium pratense TaxID=57577 RepID=UPI001E69551E|nr:two-component response regulator ORR26-like isoform X1 [Trifolium pratense]
MALPQQFSTHIRVLVIDHDINLLNAIEKVCYKFNYKVKSCSKVSDAFNILLGKKDIFDLVLIEAKMNDMDSYGFLQHVTQQINIPVIMMCDDGSRSAVMKAIDDGACDYWIKPLTESLIMNMWQHVARKLWKENKNIELMSEGVINTSVKQESVEKNNDKPESSTNKTRVKWSPEMNIKFIRTVVELNIDKATPKKILERMNVPGLTREHVASKLQKYRLELKSGGTKKQKKQNRIAEATTESKISNESSEFDFQAYDASTLHVVPNNFMPTNFPQQPNNFSHQPNNVPIKFYQTDSEEETSSPASINQQQDCNGFGTNSIINPAFISTLNAQFPNAQVRNVYLAQHYPSPNSNDSTSTYDL